ncbi:MAG: tRNA (adenosine(37)-N6)-threonylcarbamoyltransferase complex ATPase subunit type 1 TsaE [Ignavibacteriales bacterium]|nr:tRNA (adenosine(37)-N6)-threonylcarbamoyltransferase complex ATPase subunit type 1 TsaE [Ignavibacteriales bacterium]
MKSEETITTRDEVETAEAARRLARLFTPGTFAALIGDLGAGKTFFVRAVAETLGARGVSSPTFAIVNEYQGDWRIYHLDYYRVESADELYDVGVEEYFADPEAICFVEWADKFPETLPARRVEIELEPNEAGGRTIRVRRYE